MAQGFEYASQDLINKATLIESTSTSASLSFQTNGNEGRDYIAISTSTGSSPGSGVGVYFSNIQGVNNDLLNDGEAYMEFVVRGSDSNSLTLGVGDSSTYDALVGYWREQNGARQILRISDGDFSIVAGENLSGFQNNVLFAARFRCEGNVYSFKSWRLSDPEPAAFQLETTNDDVFDSLQVLNFKDASPELYAIGIGTNGDPAPTEPVGVGAEDHTAVASQVFPAPLQSASASHTEPESHTATASQVFPAPLQSATATHATPENHTASASQVFPAPLQSASASHTSAQGSTATATQVFPAPLQSATATHAAPENHSASATQVFPAPLQSAVATHTAAASHSASAAQVFPAPLQSAVATHVAPENHSATATQVFPAPIHAAVVVHSDRELKAPVRARISSAQRFTSNTSTSERIQ